MGLFDSLQNLFGGVAELGQNVLGGVASEVPGVDLVQEFKDQAASATEVLTDPLGSVTEHGQGVADEISGRLGL